MWLSLIVLECGGRGFRLVLVSGRVSDLGPLHTSPVTGQARLAGRSLSSIHMGNFSLVTEINKARPFKFHPGNRAEVFIWEISQHGYRDLGYRASPPSDITTYKAKRGTDAIVILGAGITGVRLLCLLSNCGLHLTWPL